MQYLIPALALVFTFIAGYNIGGHGLVNPQSLKRALEQVPQQEKTPVMQVVRSANVHPDDVIALVDIGVLGHEIVGNDKSKEGRTGLVWRA